VGASSGGVVVQAVVKTLFQKCLRLYFLGLHIQLAFTMGFFPYNADWLLKGECTCWSHGSPSWPAESSVTKCGVLRVVFVVHTCAAQSFEASIGPTLANLSLFDPDGV
jgi:hypothetical protein